MAEYTQRLVSDVRAILRRAQDGAMRTTDAASALKGVESAMDGSIPAAVREASGRLANDLERIAYGGGPMTIAEASARFESAIGPDAARDIQQR